MSAATKNSRARRAWRAARKRAQCAPHGLKMRRWYEMRRAMAELLKQEMAR